MIFIKILVIILTLIIATIVVAAEFGLVRVRKSSIKTELNKTSNPKKIKKLKRIEAMISNLNEYLSTIQVGITLSGLILGWIGEETITELIMMTGIFKQVNPAFSVTIATAFSLFFLTFIEVVFTELIPKNIAIDWPLKTLLIVERPIRLIHIIFYWLVWMLNYSSKKIMNAFGIKEANENDEAFTQNEIISIASESSEVKKTGIEPVEVDFMKRAFDINDKHISDIMIDRTSMITIDETQTIEEAKKLYLKTKLSRFPVTRNNNKDDLIGYVFIYDILNQYDDNKNKTISSIIRKINKFPRQTKIIDALSEMDQKNTPIAVIINKYGGVDGMISSKDIFEEMFGNFKDEFDDHDDKLVKKISDDEYIVSGKIQMNQLEKLISPEITKFDKELTNTLSGYFMKKIKEQKNKENIKIKNLTITPIKSNDVLIKEFKININ